MVQATMKAAVAASRGAANFEIKDVAVPVPGPVLIRVEACGVNYSDVKRRRGDAYPFETEFPFVPGGEIAGTVEAHGPGVEGPAVGTRVFALAGTNGFGGYAQYAVSYAQTAHPIPGPLGFDEASVLMVAGSTAKLMLTETANLKAGETILIPAATGGVGSFAVRIARQMGAKMVIAAVGSDERKDAALSLGADAAVNYSREGWVEQVRRLTEGRGVDVALEASGGKTLAETVAATASFGRIVVYGAASGQAATVDDALIQHLLYAPVPNQTLTGFNIGGWFMERPQQAGAALGGLISDVLSGVIAMPTINTMPLSKAQAVHEMLESRQVKGKIVIKPWE